MGLNSQFDAVIVGSGAGGAAAAWRLCSKGLKVLILEAGPRFEPTADYKLFETDWERHSFPTKPNSQAAITYGDLGELETADSGLASWNRVSGKLFSGTRRAASATGYVHVQGLGGTTLQFVGEAHRMHPDAMSLQSDYSTGADWPLSYADLEPLYTECENLIGVAGPADQSTRWRSGNFPLSPHPLSPAAKKLQTAGSALGMKWQENSRAALSASYDGRPPCNYCANCTRGCPIGDKGSADVTFLRHAKKTGNLTVKTNTPVLRINAAPSGRIESVEYPEDSNLKQQETPILILAAGAVQTPRLLLSSTSQGFPGGLANSSGEVGRNFMETLYWSSTGLLPGLRNSHMGLPSDAICWDQNAPDAVPGVIGGCRFNSGVQEIGLVGPVAYGTRLINGFGKSFKDTMVSSFGSAISVGAIGETIPDERSFVALHPAQRDKWDLPLPQIHSVLTPNSLRLMHHMAKTARALLKVAGVTELAEEGGSWDQFTATHVFGTCRMGHDSTTSIADGRCRSHDHPNLYISDASLFPSSGGGESPSLTIQALATWMADHITA
ncbi:MAG: GMC family oxidoreductase [Rhodobacteraceae bacterium]|nr:GMC family oxidoreductase [Paracoccaceae bacterium]